MLLMSPKSMETPAKPAINEFLIKTLNAKVQRFFLDYLTMTFNGMSPRLWHWDRHHYNLKVKSVFQFPFDTGNRISYKIHVQMVTLTMTMMSKSVIIYEKSWTFQIELEQKVIWILRVICNENLFKGRDI